MLERPSFLQGDVGLTWAFRRLSLNQTSTSAASRWEEAQVDPSEAGLNPDLRSPPRLQSCRRCCPSAAAGVEPQARRASRHPVSALQLAAGPLRRPCLQPCTAAAVVAEEAPRAVALASACTGAWFRARGSRFFGAGPASSSVQSVLRRNQTSAASRKTAAAVVVVVASAVAEATFRDRFREDLQGFRAFPFCSCPDDRVARTDLRRPSCDPETCRSRYHCWASGS